jgi:hypothetical protein
MDLVNFTAKVDGFGPTPLGIDPRSRLVDKTNPCETVPELWPEFGCIDTPPDDELQASKKSPQSASERSGNNLKGYEDLNMKAKASVWP